jgi:hypothetical protein
LDLKKGASTNTDSSFVETHVIRAFYDMEVLLETWKCFLALAVRLLEIIAHPFCFPPRFRSRFAVAA